MSEEIEFLMSVHKSSVNQDASAECAPARCSETPDDRLMSAVNGVMGIVEGVRNARWSHKGKRLVDTPEWCELYCAWSAKKHQSPNE